MSEDSCIIGFCDQFIQISCDGKRARDLVEFLFQDLQWATSAEPNAHFELEMCDVSGRFFFKKDNEQLYAGESQFELAYTVVNEILYSCIVNNTAGLVLHSAAIIKENVAILLPGKSGSGKSTLTGWLVAQGCQYLTDELVVVTPDDFSVIPFTRPLSLKKGALPALSKFVKYDIPHVISGEQGIMLPHRNLNKQFNPLRLQPSIIIFPIYEAGKEASLHKISAAQGCAMLIESYVNARNISQHGIGILAQLARDVSMYKLHYGSFGVLAPILQNTFPSLFKDIQA